ncbi:hypothetical protein DERF_008168 [Dermatophagoides farinae]|uniref:Uncharacterized protein n=1 Tax=Dermatophagoides farinae TaxID=6954 RepID=A0A922L580_DERFA|nr:hypothetical protein DERF_008168 [Dermatophagoides farinae]
MCTILLMFTFEQYVDHHLNYFQLISITANLINLLTFSFSFPKISLVHPNVDCGFNYGIITIIHVGYHQNFVTVPLSGWHYDHRNDDYDDLNK